MESETTAEVMFDRRGRLGEIALDRPRAINALTHDMVTLIRRQLDEWAEEPGVETVVLLGRGERGLCAGGDIVSLHADATSGDGAASLAFWRDEYALNAAIAQFPKPYVAFMDGIVLGGGVGLSAHGSHRIVTERSKVGLPETGIGFIPDVGATWLLTRVPGRLGTYLALSAAIVGAADAIMAGLADTYVPSDRLPRLLLALETADADVAIAAHAATAPAAELDAARGWIDEAFAAHSVPGILAGLRRDPANGMALAVADTIEQKSPIAVAVTLESLNRVAALPSLNAALEQELRVSMHALRSHDFAEGVRAQVIDRDRNPQWEPRSASEVDQGRVEAYFEPSISAP
ncbi:enoyl-CoA hydratase/isomerase family protein [Subtercola boreus]|uniref:3-hydroxyisobutyryl-CoA hydrolase n=1 Tax=Subtercola boreus TaxID=120213 RepID=A0A3E0W7D3_9MICO|nr:enoyl-CoA hydratase/isomerase family protein [Subtercola boreus]RFA18150.1 3-hydroxyisobutyryl-CoA hydrolase [Subtercola boreus]RFA18532.1 3-hydroxyisobutyryl-CoA hydrolase [Subtercola boreus]RFA25060.1 3-hydroxyisobutyryl-CoA hydrolase [Subtercola boreus]